MPFIIILGIIIILLIIKGLIIVPEGYAVIVERLGKYNRNLKSGLHFTIPFIEKRAYKICIKEQVVDFDPQEVITKDNVTVKIDTVIFYKIFNEKLFAYGAASPIDAMGNITTTTLRNIVGNMDFEETLTSRSAVNQEMLKIIDEITDSWGIKIARVEIKTITPPPDVQESMEKQMKAERANREEILRAEGYARAVKIKADADKQAAITIAEGMKESARLLNEANINESALKIQSLETWKTIANGNATKIIIPPGMESLFGIIESAKQEK